MYAEYTQPQLTFLALVPWSYTMGAVLNQTFQMQLKVPPPHIWRGYEVFVQFTAVSFVWSIVLEISSLFGNDSFLRRFCSSNPKFRTFNFQREKDGYLIYSWSDKFVKSIVFSKLIVTLKLHLLHLIIFFKDFISQLLRTKQRERLSANEVILKIISRGAQRVYL